MGNTKNLGLLAKNIIVSGSGNVGLGTTNASLKLTVRASDAPTLPTLGTASGHFLIGNGATNVDYGLMFGVNGDGDTWIQSQRVDGTATAYNTVLQPRGGNVGIGNTSPTEALTVSGSTRITGQATNFSAGSPGLNIDRISASGIIRIYGVTGTGTAGDLAIGTNNTERIRITSGGNVGIGTDSPDIYSVGGSNRFLTVSNPTSTGYSLVTVSGGAGGGGEIDFGNQTTRHAAIASINGSGLNFYTNSTNSGKGVGERMRITAAGNVGIGTENPTAISNYIIQTINGTGGSFTEWQENGTNTFRVGSDIGLGGFIYTQGAFGIRFGTNGTERMRISSTGIITTPSQPAFRAWYSINATWTLATGATFNFDVTEYNIGSCYNTSNGIFTAPVAGVYQFNFYTIVLGTYVNGAIAFRKNGGVATSGYNVHFSPTSASNWSNVVYTTSMYLNQGDYVNMINNSGFSVNFHGKDWSSFSGYLVG